MDGLPAAVFADACHLLPVIYCACYLLAAAADSGLNWIYAAVAALDGGHRSPLVGQLAEIHAAGESPVLDGVARNFYRFDGKTFGSGGRDDYN